jgi:hypothetical protein
MQDGHIDVHTYCMDKTLCPLMPIAGGIKMQLIQELNLVTANMVQTLLLFWSYAPWISDITSILELCPCLLYTVAGITGIHVLWAHSMSIEIIGFIVKRHTS